MSTKAARGTKRLCENCENKFYDLNRDPIICPICGTEFKIDGAVSAVDHIAESDDSDDDLEMDVSPNIVSLEEVQAEENAEIEAIDDENLADIEEDADIPDAGDDTFLEEEEDENPDVSGIIGGKPLPNDEG